MATDGWWDDTPERQAEYAAWQQTRWTAEQRAAWEQNQGTTTSPTGTTTPPTGVTGEQRDALGNIKKVLSEYGLPEALADWAWGLITSGAGPSEVLLELRNRPEFKAEFPEIEARRKAGLAPVSPGEIVSYRRQARQALRAAGLPEGFYDDKDDFTRLIVNDVSLAELSRRVEEGFVAAMQAPAEVREEFSRIYNVGNSTGALAAFFIDPDRAESVIKKQFVAAQIGGASKRTGYGLLAKDEAERLGALGVTTQEAEQGFSALASSKELFNPLVGQEAAEQTIDRDMQLGAAFEGNANARQAIDKQRRKRTAEYEGGGRFGASRTGFSGLGSAE